MKKMNDLFPPGLEPGTFRVLGERDNHYTTETQSNRQPRISYTSVDVDVDASLFAWLLFSPNIKYH